MKPLFSHPQHHDRQIAYWLMFIALIIFAMVILGGVTRLTGSGLSIVEWKPVVGALPPFNEVQWQEEFNKYQQSPEYLLVNKGMSLEDFKGIYVYEYAHRLLGRLVGIFYLLPFLYFLYTRKVRRELIPRLVVLFILGGLQGLVGWLMVKSGLDHEPRVSEYRLAMHLILPIMIYCIALWTAWTLLRSSGGHWRHEFTPLRRVSLLITTTVLVMIVSGAFVAGTRAGKVFNTFPLMDGGFFPKGMFALEPWYRNFFENLATVQFDHRLIAYLLMILIPGFWLYARRFALTPVQRRGTHFLMILFIVQVGLGIVTLLNFVPVSLGAAHQGGALLVLTSALYVNHLLRRSSTL